MIPSAEMLSIAERLLERTKKGEVVWMLRNRGNAGIAYYVEFGESNVQIQRFTPDTEPDFISLEAIKGKGVGGEVVGRLYGDESEAPNQTIWMTLSQLHEEAERVVTGWDKVLDEIDKGLKSEGTVGGLDI